MIFKYKKTALLDSKKTHSDCIKIKPYISHLQDVVKENNYRDPESSINLPTDNDLYREVLRMAKKYLLKKLKYIFVIGIGGSNLGTKTVYDAMKGYADMFCARRFPKLIFLDTCDTEYMEELLKHLRDEDIHPKEVCINMISKSGKTTETAVNLEVLLDFLQKQNRLFAQRIVVTTDKESQLWNEGKREEFDLLEIPKQVGGRYSVLSAVGLFPLLLGGFDILAFRKGAELMRKQCLGYEIEQNPALFSALFLYRHAQEGKTIHDIFMFHPEFESLGKWYRQLMGESIGKDKKGITPLVSIGSNDLHSVVQLYWGGPQNKTTCFVSAQSKDTVYTPRKTYLQLVENIENKSIANMMHIIQQGTMKPYADLKIPFFEIQLEEINEFSLGEFMQYKMIEMMLLGKLLGVNSFNQPHVELYKKEIRRILSEQTQSK